MRADDAIVAAWAGVTVASAALFTLMPWIDLAVSGLFFRGGAFPLAAVPWLETLRNILWSLSEAAVLVALVGLVVARATGRVALWLPGRVWGFVLALYVLAPGLIVNLGLKSHWGRARPAAVAEFGGAQAFTPALRPAEECARNCSFASGEASAAAALAISVIVALMVLRERLGERMLRQGIAVAVAMALAGGMMRVATGRHFLSDVVFAWLITAGVALVLHRLVLRTAPHSRHG